MIANNKCFTVQINIIVLLFILFSGAVFAEGRQSENYLWPIRLVYAGRGTGCLLENGYTGSLLGGVLETRRFGKENY